MSVDISQDPTSIQYLRGIVMNRFALRPFLNVGDGHWWQFQDQVSGGSARIECFGPADRDFVLGISGQQASEHQIQVSSEVVSSASGSGSVQIETFKIVQSKLEGVGTLNWRGGATVPDEVGKVIEVESKEPNPATGNTLIVRAKLVAEKPFVRPRDFPTEVIEPEKRLGVNELVFDLKLWDSKLGTKLAELELKFAFGLGVYSAVGNAIGIYSRLVLTDWYGLH
jgi:hypothetical protein